MNSLGSWIDKSELDRLVAAVGTGPLKEKPESAPEKSGPTNPWARPAKTTSQLEAPPSQLGDDKGSERFPVAEEVEKFRDKVAAIKNKARTLGVLSPEPSSEPVKDQSQQASQHPAQPTAPTAPTAPAPPAQSAPPPQRQEAAPHANFSQPVSPLKQHPSPPPQPGPRPSTGPLAAKAPPSRTHPTFQPPAGSLPEKFESFGNWVTSITHAQAVIVADGQGDMIYTRGADANWCSAVTTTANAAAEVGSQLSIPGPNVVHIDLPADRKLAVLQCKIRANRLNVGLVVPRPLEPEISLAIAEAIAKLIAQP